MIEEDHPDTNTNTQKSPDSLHLYQIKININTQRENPKIIDLMHHLTRDGDKERQVIVAVIRIPEFPRS